MKSARQNEDEKQCEVSARKKEAVMKRDHTMMKNSTRQHEDYEG